MNCVGLFSLRTSLSLLFLLGRGRRLLAPEGAESVSSEGAVVGVLSPAARISSDSTSSHPASSPSSRPLTLLIQSFCC